MENSDQAAVEARDMLCRFAAARQKGVQKKKQLGFTQLLFLLVTNLMDSDSWNVWFQTQTYPRQTDRVRSGWGRVYRLCKPG